MDLLSPVVFNDDWGSQIAIASLQGRPIPSAQPESELWMGAHESGPSELLRDGVPRTLAEVIAADPTFELGVQGAARFGDRLPFLLKILAPGRAISIQVHPSAEQVRQLRERDPDTTVYVDDWAKPELLLAVSPFEVFIGMRPFDEVAELIDILGVEYLCDLLEAVRGVADPLHALLSAILAVPSTEQRELVRSVVAACVEDEGSDHPSVQACSAIAAIAEDHPDDIGLVILLLMNHRILRPGDYVDVPAGVLHSYVRGVGVEVLANSDNVVRAGLTHKEVNGAELLRIVDTAADGRVGRARVAADGTEDFESSSDRFELYRLRPTVARILPGDEQGPRIAFCLRGSVSLKGAGGELGLGPTGSAYLRAGEGSVYAEGAGELYVVAVPGPF